MGPGPPGIPVPAGKLDTNRLPAPRGIERGGGRGGSSQAAVRRGSKMGR